MAKVIGLVKSLENGTFFVRDAAGKEHQLQAGEQLHDGDLVYGDSNNAKDAQIVVDEIVNGAGTLIVAGNDALYFDTSVFTEAFDEQDSTIHINSLNEALATIASSETVPFDDANAGATDAGETAAGTTVTDTARTGDTFSDRTSATGDVATNLNSVVNGAVSPTFNGTDTLDINHQPVVFDEAQTQLEAGEGSNTFRGQLVASDADRTDTHTFFIVEGSLRVNSIEQKGVTLTLSTDGKYTVIGDFNHLAVGENAVVSFQYYAVDNGLPIGEPHDSLSATVTLTVTGTNDTPVVAVEDVTGAVTEMVTAAGNLTDTGTISFTDVDLTDKHSISAVAPSVGALGTLTATVTTDTTDTGLGGVVTWKYTVAASAVEYLAAGQTKVESFTFDVLDGNGGIVTRTVDVTITGTNDTPIATDDIIITNIAAGQSITIAGNLLTANDTDIDTRDVLTVARVYNAVNGSVDGTNPIIFKGTASFGTNAQTVDESTIFTGDSETNPLNNDMAHAYEIARGQFGQLSATNAAYVADSSLPTFKWVGRIEDVNFTPTVTDQDYLKVYMYAGEKITLDIDGADSGKQNIGPNNKAIDMYLKLYNANGTLLAQNDDALATLGGLGSVQSAYHSNSLDSFLTYTVVADGYYYIDATAWNNNANGILHDSGDYQLMISIKPTQTTYTQSFDYDVTDGLATDSAHVTVTTVQGSLLQGGNTDEILIGGDNNDTLNGGAGKDSLNGGAGNDTLVFDASDALIDGGLGMDTLILTTGVNIDFATLGNVIKNIEIIDLSQNGAHTLDKLTVNDVLDMTDPTNHDLIILGVTSDTVHLQDTAGGAWTNTGVVDTTTIVGHTLDIYTNSFDPTVQVKIEHLVSDTIVH